VGDLLGESCWRVGASELPEELPKDTNVKNCHQRAAWRAA